MDKRVNKVSLKKRTDDAQNTIFLDRRVMDHTASMWKYKPIYGNDRDKFPEYRCEAKKDHNVEIIAASVRGKKHKHEGTNCDDWFEIGNLDDIIFMAVSDGAGSEKYSRIGARAVCNAVKQCLSSELETLIANKPGFRLNLSLGFSDEKCLEFCNVLAKVLQHSVLKAYEAVEDVLLERKSANADNSEISIRDFSSTLLIVVVIPLRNTYGEILAASFQIGDGVIALVDSKQDYCNAVKIIGVSDSGEYAGETKFLTSIDVKNNISELQMRTKIFLGRADTVFVMTDGVADDYFPYRTGLIRLYCDLVANDVIKDEKVNSSDDFHYELPQPLEYPWINDPSQKVKLNYMKHICDFLKTDDLGIWDNRQILRSAVDKLEPLYKAAESEEKLKIWLDNYIERGSFDDRTLAVAKLDLR